MEELIQAIEAKIRHDKQRDEYQGYEWGYHGYRAIQEMDNAAEKFQSYLKEMIREVVQEELNNLKP